MVTRSGGGAGKFLFLECFLCTCSPPRGPIKINRARRQFGLSKYSVCRPCENTRTGGKEGGEKQGRWGRKGSRHVPWDVIEEAYNEVRHEFFRGGNLWKGNRQKAKLWGRKSPAGTLSMIFHDNNASMIRVPTFIPFVDEKENVLWWIGKRRIKNDDFVARIYSKIMEWLFSFISDLRCV